MLISLHKVSHWPFNTDYSIPWDTVLGSPTVRNGIEPPSYLKNPGSKVLGGDSSSVSCEPVCVRRKYPRFYFAVVPAAAKSNSFCSK